MENAIVLKEVWRDIPDYEGYYQVSNFGRVKSLVGWNGVRYVQREKILSPTQNELGYYKIDLKKGKVKKSFKLHRVIATAFIPNLNKGTIINHIDCDPTNNDISNLEWCTQSQNMNHASRCGRRGTTAMWRNMAIDYANGHTVREITVKYGVNKTIVYSALRRFNVPLRERFENTKYHIPIWQLKRDFESGLSNKEIARKYKCPTSLIGRRRWQFKKGQI